MSRSPTGHVLGHWSRGPRPKSAPALLRGEGLIAKQVHHDPFRQGVEDTEVRLLMDTLRRERHAQKDVLSNVDTLRDPSIFDLRVLHNQMQRAKSAAESTRGNAQMDLCGRVSKLGHNTKNGASAKGVCTNTEQMRDLCHKLRNDISHHCDRMGLPEQYIGSSRAGRKIKVDGNVQIHVGLHDKNVAVSKRMAVLDKKKSTQIGEEIAKLFQMTKQPPGDAICAKPSDEEAAAQLLVGAAKFLMGSGCFRATLRVLDANQRGRVNMDEWVAGMGLLGFPGKAPDAFKMLAGGGAELTLKELEDGLHNAIWNSQAN